MSSLCARGMSRICVLLAAALAASFPFTHAYAQGAADWHDVSLVEYRSHLDDLGKVVSACQKARTPQACDPALAGPDDRVPLAGTAEKREIGYDWLRALLKSAGEKEEHPAQTPGPGQVLKSVYVSIDARLTLARERLAFDANQAENPSGSTRDYKAEQSVLKKILAGKEYQGVGEPSARERFLEWLANALDAIFGRLASFGRRSPWIGYVLYALVFLAIGAGLVTLLIRIERRSRTRLIPETQIVAGAPSAREWQLWRDDALAMAAQNHWREAIHFLYWATISRLESVRLWSADRARTPREYLGLMPAADERRASLTALTRGFEQTWYGGREANSSDFQVATSLAAELGVQ